MLAVFANPGVRRSRTLIDRDPSLRIRPQRRRVQVADELALELWHSTDYPRKSKTDTKTRKNKQPKKKL